MGATQCGGCDRRIRKRTSERGSRNEHSADESFGASSSSGRIEQVDAAGVGTRVSSDASEPRPIGEGPEYLAASVDTPWVRYFDENSGCEYYYNAMTGETSWEAPAHYVTDESAMDLMTTVFSRTGGATSERLRREKRVSKIVFHHMNRAMELWENGPTLNGLRQDVAAALGKPVGDALVSSICEYAGAQCPKPHRELFEEVYKTVSQLDRVESAAGMDKTAAPLGVSPTRGDRSALWSRSTRVREVKNK